MSTTSSICIPLEILHEFILQSSSSSSTLAAWCLVSQSLLSFAGPLLYRTVSLKRSEDILPFLTRLLHPSRVDSPSLLPFSKVQRLEISALPASEDIDQLLSYGTSGSGPSNSIVLVRSWREQDEITGLGFAVPALLLLIQPKSYEDLFIPFVLEYESLPQLEGPMLKIYLTKVESDFLTFSVTSISPSNVFAELKRAYLDSVEVLDAYRNVGLSCFALYESIATAKKQGLENINPLTPPLLQAGIKMLALFFFDHSGELTTLDVLLSRLGVAEEVSRKMTAASDEVNEQVDELLDCKRRIWLEDPAVAEMLRRGDPDGEMRKNLVEFGFAEMLEKMEL
ncbi:hypothetical protein BDY24DRAFT_398289 [Mrakia frigida]|uniref:uncharacterized protein n=1 Tax=Mrakia frigida TaxID=29902 RepID=UPI003FCC1A24